MARYAIVRPDNVVDNVIEWDGVTPYGVAGGNKLVLIDDPQTNPGDTIRNGILTKAPPAPAAVKLPLTVDQKLSRMGLTVAELKQALGL